MPLNAAQRKRARRERLSPRRPSRLRRAIAVSVAIHVGILLLLLVIIKQKGREEYLPPPSPVTMVFQSGRKEGPTLPEPSPQPAQPNQAPPAKELPLPVPPAPPPPPPPTPVAPPTPAPVPPAAEALPLPPPVEKTPSERPPPAPKPPPKRPPPPKPSDFPAPMNFSFGKPLGAPQPRQRAPGSNDMSLGPAKKGSMNVSPFADIDTDVGGPDWRNALAAWVSQHAYYPPQARNNGEDGDVRVHVVAEHNGRVTEVELISKSGSMWLDLALQSMFRDAHIPPLPTPGNDPIEFNFTMHYILLRGR